MSHTSLAAERRNTICNEIQGASFGDRRLGKRACKLLSSLHRAPQCSINAANESHAETAGAYRFFANLKVTPERILLPHRQQTLERARHFPRLLLIQDTSETDYTSLKTLKNSGPLAAQSRRGAFLHPHLLVAPGGLPLGIYDHEFIVRKDEDHGLGRDCKKRAFEDKESARWLRGFDHASDLQRQLKDTQVISVADREADIHEIFSKWQDAQNADAVTADFLIRVKEDRVLIGEHEGLRIFDLDQRGSALGTIEFDVTAQKQRLKTKTTTRIYQREARVVTQELRAHQVTLRVPYRRGVKLTPATITVVSAIERNPPPGQRPINWRLYTSLPVETLAEAKDLVTLYRDRWQIEVFFKTLKSGCKIEELRLKDMERLKKAIAMLSIVAWKQFYVTHLAREKPDQPCGEAFKAEEWEGTLRVISPGKQDYPEPTLGQFILIVAGLGGYLNRKHDPPPGAEVLWRGMVKVQAYGEAWLAFKQQN